MLSWYRALAKALGHPARVKILRLLAARETCTIGDVVAQLLLARFGSARGERHRVG